MKNSYESNRAFLPSLILSIFFYILIIFGVFYHMQMKDIFKKYSSKKDNFLEVAIVKRDIKLKPNITKEPTPKKQEETVAKDERDKVALKELFGKIEAKKAKPKPIPTSSEKASKASRLKKQKNASSITKSLNLKTARIASTTSTGEHNKFLGEIQEILEGYWNQTIDTTSGANAKVKVYISRQGKFSYTIVSLSYNDNFNIKLRRFLELMKDVQFPKNKGNKNLGSIVFKDVQE